MLHSPRHPRRVPGARWAGVHPAGLRLAGRALAAVSLLLALSSPSAVAASGVAHQRTRDGSAAEGVRQIVVKFRPSASRARAAAAGGAKNHASLGSRTALVRLARGASLDGTLRRLRSRS